MLAARSRSAGHAGGLPGPRLSAAAGAFAGESRFKTGMTRSAGLTTNQHPDPIAGPLLSKSQMGSGSPLGRFLHHHCRRARACLRTEGADKQVVDDGANDQPEKPTEVGPMGAVGEERAIGGEVERGVDPCHCREHAKAQGYERPPVDAAVSPVDATPLGGQGRRVVVPRRRR